MPHDIDFELTTLYNIGMEYNERIKKLRVRAGMTQQQLSDRIGVSRQSVARWENGWNVPSLYYAQKLSDIFGVTVSELMTGAERGATENGESERGPRAQNIPDRTAKRPPAILFSVIWLGVLSVAALILQQVLRHVFGLAAGTNRTLFYAFLDLNDSICGIALSVLTLWWVLKIIKYFYGNGDKFARYLEYKVWSVGLYILMISLTVFVYNVVSFVSLYLPLIYAGAAAATFPLNLAVNVVVKKALSNRMIVEKNKALDAVNLTFSIIFAVCVIALVSFIIYAATMWSPTDGLTIGFAMLYFTVASLLTIILYIATRLIVRSVHK